jgi:2'-5' RNA ligase
MEEKFLCLIATFDNMTTNKFKEIEGNLNENGIFGRQTPNIPHHITLGKYTIDCEAEIKLLLSDVCSQTEKVDVNFNSTGMFGEDILFLKPEISRALIGLHESLDKGFIKEHLEWVPHATLLIDDSEVVQTAIPIVKQSFDKIRGRIESVSLYEIFPARLLKKFRLRE